MQLLVVVARSFSHDFQRPATKIVFRKRRLGSRKQENRILWQVQRTRRHRLTRTYRLKQCVAIGIRGSIDNIDPPSVAARHVGGGTVARGSHHKAKGCAIRCRRNRNDAGWNVVLRSWIGSIWKTGKLDVGLHCVGGCPHHGNLAEDVLAHS